MKKTALKNIILFLTILLQINFAYSQNQQNEGIRSFELNEIDENIAIKNSIATELKQVFEKKKPNFKSLMYDDEEMELIKKSILALRNGESLSIGDEDSNKLSKEELAKLEAERKNKELLELNERSKIYLGSIIYITQDNWAIWLNKNKITSYNNNKDNEFFVEKISQNKADILWTLSLSKWRVLSGKIGNENLPNTNDKNQALIRFSLKTNQTFILRYNNIIEGKQVSIKNIENEELKN